MTTETTEVTSLALITLDPSQYVAEVFFPFVAKLEAAKIAADAVEIDCTTTEGHAIAVKHRAIFRDEFRLAVESARAERKAPILTIGKLLDGRAKEITAEVKPYEDRFDAAIQAEKARKDTEKAALIAAERARVDAIKDDILAIRNMAITASGKPSRVMLSAIEILDELLVTEERFAEFVPDAGRAVGETMDAITAMYHAALLTEAEAVRQQEEKDAAAALFKQQQAELAEQQAQLKRDQIAAADAEQKRLDQIEVERNEMIDAQLKADAKRALEQKEAQDKIDAAAELLRKERAEWEAEKAALIPVPEPIAEIPIILPEPQAPVMNFIKKTAQEPLRPSTEQITSWVMAASGASHDVVTGWLQTMEFEVVA